jgi:outer membrane protein OmpA-like peptidoglycan-associated protein
MAMNKTNKSTGFSAIKLSVLICVFSILSACAGKNVIELEPSVVQLKDLRDLDSDGVIEDRERCADTVLGAIIDNYGCGTQTISENSVDLDIKFDNNSYAIKSDDFPRIKQLAIFLQNHPELDVVIEGHTSTPGGAELNQVLSENRANAVASILINQHNIDEERVEAIGFGFSRLADTADTEEAHATNRRIVASLSQEVIEDDMKWTIYTVDEVE